MEKIILSIGLNDQFTKVQEIETNAAIDIVRNSVYKYVGGATIYLANGVYTHDDGTKVAEVTIRVEMYGAAFDDVKLLVSELKKLLNQESIAVEIVETNSMFL